ncbi:MAG: hypothetical protein J1E31_04240 [Helicobacter sp.]|nr:hypothetical protein [Helicobacter sp.]
MANLTNKEYLNLPLDTLLLERGYTLKRDKCSKASTILFNDKELLIVTRQSNGNYLYFNPNEEKDRGNIFSYCKNRGIKVSTLLESKNLEELQSIIF